MLSAIFKCEIVALFLPLMKRDEKKGQLKVDFLGSVSLKTAASPLLSSLHQRTEEQGRGGAKDTHMQG